MPNIRQRLLIEASPRKVYDALTTSGGVAGWWTTDARAEPEVGSVNRFGFQPGYVKEIEVIDLQPEKRVAWRVSKACDEWTGTTLMFELEGGDAKSILAAHPEMSDQEAQLSSRDEITLLSVTHEGWREETPMFAECSYTWGRFFRGLKLLCEDGNGLPWPNQHRKDGADDAV